MNPFIKKLLYWVIGLLTLITTQTFTCNATVTFSNNAANFLMDATIGELYVNNPAKITGWGERSIVKTFGDNTSNTWIENYTSGSVVGRTNLSGVTKASFTNLVDANSNAICPVPALLRATSNLLLYTARTYSSSIVVLNRRTDSTNLNVRTTSNAVNLIYQNLVVPTTDSIDGTQLMRYHTAHHVFHSGASTIRGWVRFNNGFTIMPQGTVLMDTLTTISGPIDLRDTGVLKLNNDLYLSHNVTLTAGGYIKGNAANYGQANTIFMGGDLTLASDSYGQTLHITGDWANNGQSGDLIIDGCGHTLNIGDWGQLFVDTNVTLTLRNMTIKTSPKSFARPAIKLASLGSKLALDNVLFDLGSDFKFTQGQLFIHDEVAVTGTSAFVYQSPKPSYITSGATWSFETGTTFSIAPSTYTDQPFTAGTATSNNFIVLADQSSALSLNNCSLKTTFTGARFSKGMVLFDNKVAIDTQAGSEISGLGSASGSYWAYTGTFSNAKLSPDGRYIAATYTNGGTAGIHINDVRFPGDVSKMVQISLGGSGSSAPALAWSADGKFIAVGYSDNVPTGFMRIYRFNGLSSVTQVGSTLTFGILVNAVAWSPDGRYLAVGGNNGTTPLIIYRFDGVSLTQVATVNPGGNTIQVNGVSWSPDGKNLTITGRTTNANPLAIRIYAFNGASLAEIGGLSIINPGNGCCAAWSPDARFCAVGTNSGGTTGRIYIYTGFTGTTYDAVRNVYLGSQVNAVAWSPDGRYLLACGANSGTGIYQMYRVDITGGTPFLSPTGSGPSFGGIAHTVCWKPDGKYVFIGGTDTGTTSILYAYPTNQVATSATTQSFSNGLLFGDKTQGVNFDAKVKVLSNAMVTVKGMVKDDSF